MNNRPLSESTEHGKVRWKTEETTVRRDVGKKKETLPWLLVRQVCSEDDRYYNMLMEESKLFVTLLSCLLLPFPTQTAKSNITIQFALCAFLVLSDIPVFFSSHSTNNTHPARWVEDDYRCSSAMRSKQLYRIHIVFKLDLSCPFKLK